MNELGFLDYLLIVVSLIFSWRMYQAGHPPAGAENPAFQQAAPSGAAAAGQQMPPALGAVPQDEILRRIATACHYSSMDSFITGAKGVYETVIAAFAAGDIDSCSYLLSAPVRDSFAQAIAGRVARCETAELLFIGFHDVSIVDAGLEQNQAWIELRFAAELVSVTRDRDKRVIAGSPGQVAVTSERWRFERDLRAPGPDWLLVATEADV